jgi:alanine racemase
MNLFQFIRNFFRQIRSSRFAYDNLIEVLVYKQAIIDNFLFFKSRFSKLEIAPVLKSNAYGHGLVQVAKILESQKPPFYCVDSFFEALILRNENIKTPILIIGYTPLSNIAASRLKDLSFSVLSLNELKRLNKMITKPLCIHIKIDTGMHRHGVNLEDIEEAIALIRSNSNLRLEGAYTHLADADSESPEFTERQIKDWNKTAQRLMDEFPSLVHLHCAATAGAIYSDKIIATTMRVGRGLYGIQVGSKKLDLKPALEMRTKITSLRKIKSGDSIGYNTTFTAEQGMTIATIPVGYTEGLDRRLSNKGFVTIRGRQCPIVGRVSMNISSIDVSALPEVELDDEVLVISRDSKMSNSVEYMAWLCETIAYEILVHVPAHLRRVIIA